MRIRVFLDDATTPLMELPNNSERFEIDTTKLADGAHRLRLETMESGRVTGNREIPFTVRNGPGISVAGLVDNDEVSGKLHLVANASDAGINQRLDVHALEVHRGLPFWIGGISLAALLLAAGYVATDPLRFRSHLATEQALEQSATAIASSAADSAPAAPQHDPRDIGAIDGTFLPVLPFEASKGNEAHGKAIYVDRCADCHGNAAQGRTVEILTQGAGGVYPRLAGQQPAYLYRQLYSFANGWRHSDEMQPMAMGLSDQDKTDIAVYLGGLTQTPNANVPPQASTEQLEIGRLIATRGFPDKGVSRCDGCHGPNGAGVGPHFPSLRGQNADYLAAQIEAFRSGQRRNALFRLMEPVAHGLDADQIEAVTRYYESLKPDDSS